MRPSMLSAMRLVIWLCCIAGSVGLITALAAEWALIAGIPGDHASLEGAVIGCLIEGGSVIFLGLLLLAAVRRARRED